MKPFERIHRIFVSLCFCPMDETVDKKTKLRNFSILIVTFVIQFVSVLSSIVFIMKNLSTDLPKSLGACYQASAMIALLLTIIIAYNIRQGIENIFTTAQNLYDLSNLIFQVSV